MTKIIHITSGDCAGDILSKSGLPGEVFVWHDLLYDGPRNDGWPEKETFYSRAIFLEQTTGGGLDRKDILGTLKNQYEKLANIAKDYEKIILWFDACLFDQSMLVHILACMFYKGIHNVELICVDAFPGIIPFNGLGQLKPSDMMSLYEQRCPVTDDQFHFAKVVDKAFANQDLALFTELSGLIDAPLLWIPAAVTRWLQEQPDIGTGLGRLESLAMEAVRDGNETPADIFSAVAASDTPPQYWGDITLWGKLNALADRKPPLVRIDGPMPRLPQWEGIADLKRFRITEFM